MYKQLYHTYSVKINSIIVTKNIKKFPDTSCSDMHDPKE